MDLRPYLKRGDRVRIDYGIFTIPIEGGFRAPIEGYDDLEDIDQDTHLVKDDPPRFTKMFLQLDRPWPGPLKTQRLWKSTSSSLCGHEIHQHQKLGKL